MPGTTRVLLVEDNPGDAAIAKHVLANDPAEHFELLHVRSLEQALLFLRQEVFHVVLLDLNLPDSDDLDTVTQVIESNSGLPVVILSGHDDEEIALQAVKAGAEDYVAKSELISELDSGRLPRVIQYAIERNKLKLQLSKDALYDEVTELPTRRLLRDRWAGAKARARRERAWIGVLVIDLDDFKAINDRLGHAAGDRALRIAAQRLRGAVRQNDTVARVGGDEFVILLETIRGMEDVREVAKKLRFQLCDGQICSDLPFKLEASIGVSICHPDQPDDLQDLISRADVHMYHQKRKKCPSLPRLDDLMPKDVAPCRAELVSASAVSHSTD